MIKTNIIDLCIALGFDYKKYIEDIIRIGDLTAKREYKGQHYRRNYERAFILMSLLHKYKISKFLEFGTGRGFSVACVLFLNPKTEAYTIDINCQDNTKKLISSLGIDISNATFIKAKSNSIKFVLPDVDMVFIDGGHTFDEVKNDFEISKKICKKGFIVFDDFRKKHKGVKKYIKSIVGEKILVQSDSWIIKNDLIHKVGNSDTIIDGKEYDSGQVIFPVNTSLENLL